jgi:hypothetical protein
MKRAGWLLCLFLLSGCQSAPDDALLAILTSFPSNPRVTTCLTILGHDPSPKLLAGLRSAKRRVVAGSTCTRGAYLSLKTATGSPAERVSITKFERVVPWRARAEYSESIGGVGGGGWRVTLEKQHGIWIVRSTKGLWES